MTLNIHGVGIYEDWLNERLKRKRQKNMSLTQKLKDDLLTARKERNELKSNILRVLLGEIEQIQVKTGVELPEEKIHSIIRKLVESNKQTYDLQCKSFNIPIVLANPDQPSIEKLRDMLSKSGGTTDLVWGPDLEFKVVSHLLEENAILASYLPTLLNPLEILALISPELHTEILLSDEKSLGKFTGKILKLVKEKGLTSNGNDVNKVIQDIRVKPL